MYSLSNREVLEHEVVLLHQGHFALQPRAPQLSRVAVEDGAAVDHATTTERAEQCRLASAARPHDGKYFALRHAACGLVMYHVGQACSMWACRVSCWHMRRCGLRAYRRNIPRDRCQSMLVPERDRNITPADAEACDLHLLRRDGHHRLRSSRGWLAHIRHFFWRHFLDKRARGRSSLSTHEHDPRIFL